MKLFEAIASCPKSLFSIGRGEDRKPNYGAIFVHAVAALLDSRKVKYQRETLEKIGEHVNLSSFQRAVATERLKRSADGEPRAKAAPKPAKPAKVAPTRTDSSRAMEFRAEKARVKAEHDKQAADARAARLAKAKEATQARDAARKAAKAPTKKPAKAAKAAKAAPTPTPAPEVDPISGEVIP